MSDRTESTFSLRYAVKASIAAGPAEVWARLVDAPGFPTWNSTAETIQGEISLGCRLALRVPIAPGRTFKPTVAELEPERRMVRRDGFLPMFPGTRTFTLRPISPTTEFEMEEVWLPNTASARFAARRGR